MTQVHSYSKPVHFSYGLPTQDAQSRIGRFQTAITIKAPVVVAELHDPNTEIAEQLDTVQIISEHCGALKTEDNPEASDCFSTRKVTVLANNTEPVRVALYLVVPKR